MACLKNMANENRLSRRVTTGKATRWDSCCQSLAEEISSSGHDTLAGVVGVAGLLGAALEARIGHWGPKGVWRSGR